MQMPRRDRSRSRRYADVDGLFGSDQEDDQVPSLRHVEAQSVQAIHFPPPRYSLP